MPVLLEFPGDSEQARAGRAAIRDEFAETMTALAPMTRMMRLDVPAGCAGAQISRQAIGPLSLIEFGGLDYCQTATAKTVDGVPEGISLAVRPAGQWSLSQADWTRGSATNDFLTLVDVTQPMRVEPDSGTRLFQMFFSAAQLGLSVDAIRVAAASIEHSPLRGLVARHVLQLSAEGLDLLPPETQRSLAGATIELVRALLTSIGRPGEQTGSEIGREGLRFAAKQYIRRHLRDPGLSPAVVARAHHVSVRHLYQVWDEPVSLARWIGQLRLEAAHADLADPRLTHKSIAAVAREWGFPSPAHFARRFKEVYAVSPRDWRGASKASWLCTGAGRPPPDHSWRPAQQHHRVRRGHHPDGHLTHLSQTEGRGQDSPALTEPAADRELRTRILANSADSRTDIRIRRLGVRDPLSAPESQARDHPRMCEDGLDACLRSGFSQQPGVAGQSYRRASGRDAARLGLYRARMNGFRNLLNRCANVARCCAPSESDPNTGPG